MDEQFVRETLKLRDEVEVDVYDGGPGEDKEITIEGLDGLSINADMLYHFVSHRSNWRMEFSEDSVTIFIEH